MVNALLATMIAGLVAVAAAMLMKLRDAPVYGLAGVTADERIVSADATPERVTLVLRDAQSGAERVVVLDGGSFRPLGQIDATPEAGAD